MPASLILAAALALQTSSLMLQGDHGKVRFRNIVVTPAR
jgi:hypothetical protein